MTWHIGLDRPADNLTIEKGHKKQVDVMIVCRLAKALGVGVDYLAGADELDMSGRPPSMALADTRARDGAGCARRPAHNSEGHSTPRRAW